MRPQPGRLLRGRAAVAMVVAAVLWAAPAAAQYFGRNKVQYEEFDFFVLETEHFKIYSYIEDGPVVRDCARMAERWYSRFRALFDIDLEPGQPLILYASHADFQQTNVVSEMLGQGTGGFTEGLKNRIVLPLTGVYADNDHVIGHELVHAFQYRILKQERRNGSPQLQVPLWFIEGMAEYLSLGRRDALTATWLRDGVVNDDVPSIKDIGRHPEYFPYRWGHAVWAWLAARKGDEVVPRLLRGVLASGWDDAFKKIMDAPLDSLSLQWQADVRATCAPMLEGRTRPDDLGEPILVEGLGHNFAPLVSPGGETMAVLSQQDVFSLDLYLVDVATGEVMRKLTDSTTDAHFDALRFINSSGAWSPDGRRLAFVVVEHGNDRVAILDVDSDDLERTIALPGVDGITDLAWSPDGTTLAVAGTSEGLGDLWLYDLADGGLTRLTEDRYADLQPAWSPDGRTLAFVTDRGSGTDLDILALGHLKLALMDLGTRQLRIIDIGVRNKHINPQWSPDGGSLYFLADPDGISDVYRYDLGEDAFYRVTRVATAVGGLTGESPAMSVSRFGGRMVFTVFSDREYHVRALEPDALKGEPLGPQDRRPSFGTDLPPPDGEPGLVDRYLQEPDLGLASGAGFSRHPYHPSLGLTYVGQAGVGVVVDRFGTGLGGGATFMFTDLLGNRQLIASAMVQGQLKDAGGQVLYQNLSHRWNWGAVLGHIPYRTIYVRYGREDITGPDGKPASAATQELIIERVYLDRVAAIGEYPLSTNRRLEFSGGFTRYGFDRDVITDYYLDGVYYGTRETNPDAPPALNMFQGSAAFVGDYSFFGFTSPIRGKRFRFEVEPTVGSISFATFLADYRQYVYLSPLTFAVRALHYGRYFGDSEDRRLSPLFIGYDTLVRGYDLDSIALGECGNDPNGACPVVDRLIGSRIGVFNAEVRLPLFGTEAFGLVDFPYLPTELAVFLDGGVAWTDADPPKLVLKRNSNERIPVFSSGVAARMNLLGVVVLQAYLAYPFQRPDKDHEWGFAFAPGW